MKVIVTDYNPAWPEAFEREAADLRAVFGELLVAIHHIGSTAVPGLKAKPVIDMMPVVTDIGAVDALNQQMSSLGYTARGEGGIPGRRYFFREIEEIVKADLAPRVNHDIEAYMDGKDEFVQRLQDAAVKWYLRARGETP